MTVPLLIPPVVTSADRAWSLDQCPPWAVRAASPAARPAPGAEIADDGAPLEVSPYRKPAEPRPLDWDWFVATQVEAFEAYFAHERKTRGDWSRLWRKVWWPRADPRKRAPKSAPKVPHPHWKRGTPGYAAALAVATAAERVLFERVGVAQFRPDDPRLAQLQETAR